MTVFALRTDIRVRSYIANQMPLRLGVQRARSKHHIALRKRHTGNGQCGDKRGEDAGAGQTTQSITFHKSGYPPPGLLLSWHLVQVAVDKLTV